MLRKVAVHGNAVFIRVKVDPVRLCIDNPVTFLQDKDVACDLRPRIGFKSIIRQTDGP